MQQKQVKESARQMDFVGNQERGRELKNAAAAEAVAKAG
jgi:hypothetical protein